MTGPHAPGAALSPRAARIRAARLLVAAGYGVAGRATRGDSVYLERPGLAGRIRVSDHRTSPGRRGRLAGPTVSVVIDRAVSERQLAARVAGALAEHARAGAAAPIPPLREGPSPPASGRARMPAMTDRTSHAAHARTILAASDARRQIAPLSETDGLDLAGAYAVAAHVRAAREARGARVVGRKIGFTNRTIWAEYGVFAPILGYVYDTTLRRADAPDDAFDLAPLMEPRIEPEIMFALARAPEPGMDSDALLACVEWVAHGFEIVQSLYPGWRFAAADTVAAFGLHGGLVLGEPVAIAPGERLRWRAALAGFEIALLRDGAVMDRGAGENVLGGGPLAALEHAVALLAEGRSGPPLQAGEIVSTGTLTRALPVAPGETWSTELAGLPLPGARLRFG